MPQLDPTYYTSQIFWLLLCMLSIIVFVKRVFLPKMGAIFESREIKISSDEEKMRDAVLMTNSIMSGYNEKIKENKNSAIYKRELKIKEFEAVKDSKFDSLKKEFLNKRLFAEKEKNIDVFVDKKFQDILLKR